MDRNKPPRIDLFCRNADGEIVIVSKVWWACTITHAALTLYVARNQRRKVFRLLSRNLYDKQTHSRELLESMRDTVAHLWAMKHGVSDYVVVHREPELSTLFHPSELNQPQENHHVV